MTHYHRKAPAVHITQDLETGTLEAVTEAIITLNVPKRVAKQLARELIVVATDAGQSITGHLIPWILSRPKFPPEAHQ